MQMIELRDTPLFNTEIVNNLLKIKKNGYITLPTFFLSIPLKEVEDQKKFEKELVQTLNHFFNTNDYFLILYDSHSKYYLEPAFQAPIAKGITNLKEKIMSIITDAKIITKIQDSNEILIISRYIRGSYRGHIFTKNPLNGLDETILEIIPDDPNPEAQIEHIIAEKGKLSTENANKNILKFPWIKTIFEEVNKLERLFGKTLFLEWVYNEELFWVQIRQLEEMKSPPIYSNKIAKDMLPGLIKPLVWSINTRINGVAWKRLIDKMIGENNFELCKMTKKLYGRAYFNMGLFGDFFALFGMPRETLELMMLGETHSRKMNMIKVKMNMRALRFLPKLTVLLIKNIDISKKIEKFIQNQKNKIDLISIELPDLDEKSTIGRIEKLLELSEDCAVYVIVVRMIRSFHFSLLRSMLKLKGLDSNVKIDCEDLKDIDPKYSLYELKKMMASMPMERELFENNQIQSLENNNSEFMKAYRFFLKKFGHMSDSTVDLSSVQWQEDRLLILQMIKSANIEKKHQNIIQDAPKGLYGFTFQQFFKSFITFEKQSARLGYLYAYGYSKLRPCFMHIGSVFKSKKIINETEDIFFLNYNEINEILETGNRCYELLNIIEKRKKELRDYSDIIAPEVIFGNGLAPVVKRGTVSNRLKGLAASKGYFQGRIKVIKTLSDASKVMNGDAIIIPFSDASWTPILSKAGAIISDTGGILSHCSIVAREFGIPAVVGVEGAMMIPDNVEVRIDGYNGEILVIG